MSDYTYEERYSEEELEAAIAEVTDPYAFPELTQEEIDFSHAEYMKSLKGIETALQARKTAMEEQVRQSIARNEVRLNGIWGELA